MLPSLPPNNLPNGGGTHTIAYCQFPNGHFSRNILRADLVHQCICQLRVRVLGTRSAGANITPLRKHISVVIAYRTEKQVGRTDTPRIVTLMAYCHPIRDITVLPHIRKAVGVMQFLVTFAYNAIAFGGPRSLPFPAGGSFHNFIPKPISQRKSALTGSRRFHMTMHAWPRTVPVCVSGSEFKWLSACLTNRLVHTYSIPDYKGV
jgi:hypothetical protein